jgi:hypothetical protein
LTCGGVVGSGYHISNHPAETTPREGREAETEMTDKPEGNEITKILKDTDDTEGHITKITKESEDNFAKITKESEDDTEGHILK